MAILHLLLPVSIVLSVIVGLASCGSARRGEPIAGRFSISSPEMRQGQKVFMKYCDQCHPGGEAGLAPAINNKPLPTFLMRFQVRHGVGAMPAFNQQDISEEDLDHLLTYLKELKSHG